MDGFTVEHEVATPVVEIDDSTRELLIQALAAAIAGMTPEEITTFAAEGFPEQIAAHLALPLVHDEMSDHVNVFLSLLQSDRTPAGV